MNLLISPDPVFDAKVALVDEDDVITIHGRTYAVRMNGWLTADNNPGWQVFQDNTMPPAAFLEGTTDGINISNASGDIIAHATTHQAAIEKIDAINHPTA